MAVPLPAFALALLTSLIVVLGVIGATHVVVHLAARRWRVATELNHAARIPFRVFLVVLAVSGVVGAARPAPVDPASWSGLALLLRLAAIGTGAWLIAAVLLFLEDIGLRRLQTDVLDNRNARRLRTQVLVVRRLTVALIVLIALGAGLLSFPGVRAVGASLLASAGLISVVAAVAAQSTLANVFAGIQLAFSDAIRLDDVVVVEQEWGRIEEMTLSYVVVRLWDDRRLVLPATYFATKPFQNWTRDRAELLGSVEVDLDWRVDLAALRAEIDRALDASPLWDRRAKAMQVTDAVQGRVRVRALMTAVDAPTLFDLRCEVREAVVSWARRHDGGAALPRHRLELAGEAWTTPEA